MSNRLAELAALFVKLGTVGFGGPAAHIGVMQHEVVERRGWLSRDDFLDMVGATNLIPGPNSTEMAIHVGYRRAGAAGLCVAGAAFILPATLITTAAAWAYVQYGSLPEIQPLLAGAQPAVLAIIVVAVWRLARTAVKNARLAAVGLAVAVAPLLGAGEVTSLLAGGVVGMLLLRLTDRSRPARTSSAAAWVAACWTSLRSAGARAAAISASAVLATGAAVSTDVDLPKLGLFFLKIGAVLYGSGYVLVAYLEGQLVHDYGWLTERELLDAIAIGQFTPGPILSTATFIGYVLAGPAGAVVATLGIFLPSFVFVAAVGPLVPRMRRSVWIATFLDAVNVSSVGLMAAVAGKLLAVTLYDSSRDTVGWSSAAIALAVGVLAGRYKVSAPWLILGAAAAGWLLAGMPLG